MSKRSNKIPNSKPVAALDSKDPKQAAEIDEQVQETAEAVAEQVTDGEQFMKDHPEVPVVDATSTDEEEEEAPLTAEQKDALNEEDRQLTEQQSEDAKTLEKNILDRERTPALEEKPGDCISAVEGVDVDCKAADCPVHGIKQQPDDLIYKDGFPDHLEPHVDGATLDPKYERGELGTIETLTEEVIKAGYSPEGAVKIAKRRLDGEYGEDAKYLRGKEIIADGNQQEDEEEKEEVDGNASVIHTDRSGHRIQVGDRVKILATDRWGTVTGFAEDRVQVNLDSVGKMEKVSVGGLHLVKVG